MSLLKDLKISRRFALRGALGGIGVAMWLPVLDAMCNGNGTAFAAGEPLPTSFGIWFWGNGIHADVWTPTFTGSGSAWELSKNLQDFAEVKPAMTLVTGLNMAEGLFMGHGWGVVYVLAGGDGTICTKTREIAAIASQGNHEFETPQATQYQPTIDQTIADALHTNEPLKSFETGMLPFVGDVSMGTPGANLAHRGPNNFLPPRRDLKVAFDDLFSGLPTPPPGAGEAGTGGTSQALPSDISAKMHKSALDAVLEDLKRLKPSLGADDNARIDSHVEGVRELEMQIERLSGVDFGGTGGASASNGGPTSACKVPAVPTATIDDMTAKSQAMNRLIAAGLACNLTRVFTHMWSGPRSDNTYPTLSISGGHHAYTHGTDGQEPRNIERYIMSQYADLAKVMQATPMGASTLLDQTLIYGISELAGPRDHIMKDYHVVLMGHAGGKLPGNRHVRLVGRNVTELVLTLQQLMGLNVTTWGSWDRTSKTLTEIL